MQRSGTVSLLEPPLVCLGVLSAFLASRCQRGRERRDLRVCVSCVCCFQLFSLLSFEPWVLTSYGVRHMHSIYPS